ncbi:MAG: type II toxin-antitoxin system RelE/ParE family toxin [Planctomycetes bacterium]|nr:type II toxin-antitoxin system RelE/ParE family toxin [Planctomycetota bacterium]
MKEIGRYIAKQSQSLETALRFLNAIDAKCEQYARQPMMGTTRPDLQAEVRCFSVGSYVVLYRPITDGILVLLVVHGHRDIPSVSVASSNSNSRQVTLSPSVPTGFEGSRLTRRRVTNHRFRRSSIRRS